MRKGQVNKVNIYISGKRKDKAFSEYVGEFHLRFVERVLNQKQLTKEEKIAVLDGILENLKDIESVNKVYESKASHPL